MTEQASGTAALLQAVSAVNDSVVWASGHRATWVRTTDGGRTWTAGSMTGPDSLLQFRDVHALSADTAWLLAAGPGEASRIYFTADGGATWRLQFLNRDTSAFFDCFDFWDSRRGVAVSDAVDGRMVVIVTDDGGGSWTRVPPGSLPRALEGEGAFAASGTCLVTGHGGRAWFGTGSASGARVHMSEDYGQSWSAVATPVVHGPASGISTLAMREGGTGFALGGVIGNPRDTSAAVATTADGGRSWAAAPRFPFTGAAYGSALLAGDPDVLVAVGPGGLAAATDCRAARSTVPGQRSPALTWTPLSTRAYWAVGFSGRTGWAVGPDGRITRIELVRGC